MINRFTHEFLCVCFQPEETNQKSEWSSVWQGQRAFDPYVVPFPIHMGFPLKGKDPPPPVGNLELMKVKRNSTARLLLAGVWLLNV